MNATLQRWQQEARPITYTGEMIRALLADLKTQTRRIVATDGRPQSADTYMHGFPPDPQNVRMCGDYAKCDAPAGARSASYRVPCPYGRAGDILRVREAFCIDDCSGLGRTWVRGRYLADDQPFLVHLTREEWDKFKQWKQKYCGKPAMYCFRSLSRIYLELEFVRVQRVQAISFADACAEGLLERPHAMLRCQTFGLPSWGRELWRMSPIDAFEALWDRINAKRGFPWHKNPYVWALTFRRLPMCPRCVVPMEPGKAIVSTLGGIGDFRDSDVVVTLSPKGPGRMIDVNKCPACGHSESTKGTPP